VLRPEVSLVIFVLIGAAHGYEPTRETALAALAK
jgi:hypothetical protein